MKNLFTILFISLFIFSCDSDSNPMSPVDECGVSGGDNSTCTDECGIVNGDVSTKDVILSLIVNWLLMSVVCVMVITQPVDECGIVNGDNSTCEGCDGVPNSGLVTDECGVCDGDNSTCTDEMWCFEWR